MAGMDMLSLDGMRIKTVRFLSISREEWVLLTLRSMQNGRLSVPAWS